MDEDADRGHGRFSGLAFLLPALFPPAHSAALLEQVTGPLQSPSAASSCSCSCSCWATAQKAAAGCAGSRQALREESEAGGGHTGWSAARASILHAHAHAPPTPLAS